MFKAVDTECLNDSNSLVLDTDHNVSRGINFHLFKCHFMSHVYNSDNQMIIEKIILIFIKTKNILLV